MSEEELNDIQTLEVDINDVDDLALGLEVCAKKSNMVIEEFSKLIIKLQEENERLKAKITKAKIYMRDKMSLREYSEHYMNIMLILKGDSNED